MAVCHLPREDAHQCKQLRILRWQDLGVRFLLIMVVTTCAAVTGRLLAVEAIGFRRPDIVVPEIQQHPNSLMPPVCLAIIDSTSIPSGTIGLNATTGSYDYSGTWTVNYHCDGGTTSGCAVCYVVTAAYTTNDGATWTQLIPGSGSSGGLDGCGDYFQLAVSATISGLVLSADYQLQYGALPSASDGTCDNWTEIYRTQTFIAPSH
jgi:hypothetical protein